MALTQAERQDLQRRCTLVVPGFAEASPADEFSRMAAWCARYAVQHDRYGDGEVVQALERKVAGLVDKPAAVLMPSGVMAQLAAVRIWTEAAGLARVGLHPTSHLLLHEEQAFAALLGCHAVPIGNPLRPLVAADLLACAQPLACAIVELPIREAGGQLPSWDELDALKAAARERGVRLHMDGARLWECAAHYAVQHKRYADIAGGFDSVYVSLYKGIGGLAGAVLCGDDAFIAQARLWRRRMGGTLPRLAPLAVSAALRLDERLALMPALHRCTLELAAGLRTVPGLRVNPAVPQVNMFHLHLDAPADAVADARDQLAADSGVWLFGAVRAADVPDWSFTEITIGDRLLAADCQAVIALFARLAERLRQGSAARS